MVQKRPVTAFLALTFAISYGAGLPFNFAVSPMLERGSIWATYVPRLVTVFGPAIAALIVSRGKGLRTLRMEMQHAPWLLVSVVIGMVGALAAFALAGADVPRVSAALFALHLAIQILTVGIGEELGWRGWLLPALAERHSFGAATALTGIAWAVWHGPVFFSGWSVASSFVVLLAAMSVLLAWLWRMTRSVIVVAVAHAAANAPFFYLESLMRDRAATAFAYFAAGMAILALPALPGMKR